MADTAVIYEKTTLNFKVMTLIIKLVLHIVEALHKSLTNMSTIYLSPLVTVFYAGVGKVWFFGYLVFWFY